MKQLTLIILTVVPVIAADLNNNSNGDLVPDDYQK